MMRFRGRRKDDGEFVYGYHMKIGIGDLNYVHAIQIFERGVPVNIAVHKDSIGMSTGTNDMNMNEIFEGDTVRSMGAVNISGKVIFWKGAFWIDGVDRAGEPGRDLLYKNCVKLVSKG